MQETKTDNKSIILIYILIISAVIALSLSFYKYLYQKDFLLYIKDKCEPSKENCFVHDCELEDSRCSSLENGKFFYKIIYTKDYKATSCENGNCITPICGSSDKSCSVVFCSENNLVKFNLSGDYCSSK